VSGEGTQASPLWSALRVLRERWWVVVAVPLVTTAIAVGLASTATKSYEASSRLLIRESSLGGSLVGVPDQSTSDPQRLASTSLALVTSNAVGMRVKQALKLPDDPAALIGQTSVSAEPDSDLVSVTVSDTDPERAAKIANAFAQQFVAFRRDSDRETILQGERQLEQRIAALSASQTDRRRQLEDALAKLQALEVVQTGNAQVIDLAAVPTEPASPKPKRDAALGLVLGLALGLALAFLIEQLDRRVKTVEEFESLYRMRALTSVTDQQGRQSGSGAVRDRTAQLEPYRILRSSLAMLSPGGGPQIILVTSAVLGEGKSTVAAGLAEALALAGDSVILVEADLRRPSLHRHFPLEGDRRGLTTALIGGTPPSELLRSPIHSLRSLRVLPSGPLPPASAELLRSAEMSRLLEELKGMADVVILDAPPLLPVADAQVLLANQHVDACVVVARAFRTTRDEARRARAALDRHRIEQAGLVVTGLRQHETGYGY
jgi:succinoglycan biosynthesis transport protein ExoP